MAMLIIRFISLLLPFASAFLNIEDVRQNNKDPVAGSLNIDLALQKGNAEKSRAGVQTLNAFNDEENEYLVIGNYKYGESRGTKDQNEGSAHVRYARWFFPYLAGETFIQRSINEFQNLFYRQLYGAGMRYAVFKEENSALYTGAGAFYEDEKLRTGIRNRDTRGNFYVSYLNEISETAMFSLVTYYQPNADDLQDFRLNVTTGLSSAITEKWTMNLSIDLMYDSRPPDGVSTQDTAYTAGLAYKY